MQQHPESAQTLAQTLAQTHTRTHTPTPTQAPAHKPAHAHVLRRHRHSPALLRLRLQPLLLLQQVGRAPIEGVNFACGLLRHTHEKKLELGLVQTLGSAAHSTPQQRCDRGGDRGCAQACAPPSALERLKGPALYAPCVLHFMRYDTQDVQGEFQETLTCKGDTVQGLHFQQAHACSLQHAAASRPAGLRTQQSPCSTPTCAKGLPAAAIYHGPCPASRAALPDRAVQHVHEAQALRAPLSLHMLRLFTLATQPTVCDPRSCEWSHTVRVRACVRKYAYAAVCVCMCACPGRQAHLPRL